MSKSKARECEIKPKHADLELLQAAYKEFERTAVERAKVWAGDFRSGKEVIAIQKADADAFKPVQQAYIFATRYVNHEDRWPLVREHMVLKMLREYGLWNKEGPDVTEAAYVKVNGPR